MLIKNTDATHCKIKDIKVSGSEAYITILVYSSKPQTTEDEVYKSPSRVFSFYLKDYDSEELIQLSRNNYWVDRCNNYNNDSTNIDINMYKEIIFTVDISNLNTSEMLNSKWFRKCKILILDSRSSNKSILWESDYLELLSTNIVLPEILDVKIAHSKNNLNVSFKQHFETQEDFNYSNSNLNTIVEIKSDYTKKTLKSYTIDNYNIEDEYININFDIIPNSPFIVLIKIVNTKGDIVFKKEIFYNPTASHKIFIKQNNIIIQPNICSVDNKNVISITNK